MLGNMKRTKAMSRVLSRGLRVLDNSITLNIKNNHMRSINIIGNSNVNANNNNNKNNIKLMQFRSLSTSAFQVTEFKTIPELAEEACKLFADRDSFGTRKFQQLI